jgi:hypothetical protein
MATRVRALTHSHTHSLSLSHTQTRTHAEICNIYCFSTVTTIGVRASVLRYTYIASYFNISSGGVILQFEFDSNVQLMVRYRSVGIALRAGRSGDRIPVGARFSATFQTGPGTHPATCLMDTGSLYQEWSGITLTTHSF